MTHPTPISRRGLLAAGSLILPASAHAQPATPPRKGGILRFCRPDGPDTLDPQQTNSFSGADYGRMVYDNLVTLDADNQPLPELATAWEAEKAGLEWVLTLREGVRFHNGDAFTSADVVATIERSMDRGRAGFSFGAFGPVKEARAEGPLKLRVVLANPFGEFAVNLAYRGCCILPAKNIDGLRESPNGTGPFVFKDVQPGSSLTVERNPNYGNAGAVHLDGVRMVFIREAVAMQAALRGGQVDLITSLGVETFLAMRSARGFRAYSSVTGDHQAVQMMATMAPFDNPKVREAFRYIPDRKAILASALFGQGNIGNDVTVPPGNPYLAEMPQYEQDLPRAKRLLEESGVGPISLDFWTTSDRPPAPKMVLAFAEAAARIGVTLRIRDIPYTEYAANVARKMPLYTTNWGGSATLFDGVHKYYHSKAVYNYSGHEAAPGLDAKLDAMIAEVDLAKRKALAAECLRVIHDSSDRIVPYFRNYVGVTSEKVQGFTPPRFGVIETRGLWLSA